MKKFNLILLVVVLFSIIGCASCAQSRNTTTIKPSDNYITKTVTDISDFDKIEVLGSPTIIVCLQTKVYH